MCRRRCARTKKTPTFMHTCTTTIVSYGCCGRECERRPCLLAWNGTIDVSFSQECSSTVRTTPQKAAHRLIYSLQPTVNPLVLFPYQSRGPGTDAVYSPLPTKTHIHFRPPLTIHSRTHGSLGRTPGGVREDGSVYEVPLAY